MKFRPISQSLYSTYRNLRRFRFKFSGVESISRAGVEITISMADNHRKLSDGSTAICGSDAGLLQCCPMARILTACMSSVRATRLGCWQKRYRSCVRWQTHNTAYVRRRWEVSVQELHPDDNPNGLSACDCEYLATKVLGS